MSQQVLFEQTLGLFHKAYCYRVSPDIELSGFKCDGWSQNDIVFSGDVRVFSIGDDCFLALIDPETQQERTRFPIEFRGGIPLMEKAIDSSRYFVIIVRNAATNQVTNVGLGFQDRETAFGFGFALSEHGKWLVRKSQKVEEPVTDFSLKEGESIKLNLKVGNSNSSLAKRDKPATTFVSSFAPPPGF